jgi:Uma2 family endonuclease
MAMPHVARRYTVEEVQAFPSDGNRYEVVHGELLVTPSPAPRHQVLVVEFVARLRRYLEPLGLERTLFTGPADISWDEETLVQPDLLVVAPEEVSADWRTYRTLHLAVEILSPSSSRGDRVVKRRLYQERRVGTYWIVDPDARTVEVWHPDDERPEIVTDVLRWRVTDGTPEMEIELDEVFRGMPG